MPPKDETRSTIGPWPRHYSNDRTIDTAPGPARWLDGPPADPAGVMGRARETADARPTTTRTVTTVEGLPSNMGTGVAATGPERLLAGAQLEGLHGDGVEEDDTVGGVEVHVAGVTGGVAHILRVLFAGLPVAVGG